MKDMKPTYIYEQQYSGFQGCLTPSSPPSTLSSAQGMTYSDAVKIGKPTFSLDPCNMKPTGYRPGNRIDLGNNYQCFSKSSNIPLSPHSWKGMNYTEAVLVGTQSVFAGFTSAEYPPLSKPEGVVWSRPSSENGDDTDPILLPISGSLSSSSSTSPFTDRLELEAAELRNYMARVEGSQDIIGEVIPQIPWTVVGRKSPSLVWESSKQVQVLNQSLGEIQCLSIGGDIISSPKASTNCTEN